MFYPYYQSPDSSLVLYKGDSLEVLKTLGTRFDMIFADPPYFLSTGNGMVNINGQYIKFDKGDWDRVRTRGEMNVFNMQWLSAACRLLKGNGTIWVCGTYHNIFSIEKCLDELGFKIINMIVWQKPDPPESLTDRRFSFSAEYIIWATRKSCKGYTFNLAKLAYINGGVPMQDVWRISAAGAWEKTCGKHPTQKPLRLLYRIIMASTDENDLILDPFAGSSTTGVAANLLGRKFIGIEQKEEFVELSKRRLNELISSKMFNYLKFRMIENPEEVMVIVNHAKSTLVNLMIENGICYLRAGDSKGSVLVTYGFERMQYLLLHTNGENPRIFRLKNKGSFKIWTKETLEQYGFLPEHSAYYIVLEFYNHKELIISPKPNLKQKILSYRAKVRPLSDFVEF